MTETRIRIGEWEFDVATHELAHGDKRFTLENRQAQLLRFLADNAGRDVSKEELLELWRPRVVNEDALYVCIANLRKALGDEPRSPRYIKTLPGFGYRLLAPVEVVADVFDKPVNLGRRTCWLLAAAASAVLAVAAIVLLWPDAQPARHDAPPAAVADDYQRARYLLSEGAQHRKAALTLLRDIMVRAPSFADAYALAAYHQGNTVFGARQDSQALAEVNAWIDHALSLNPELRQAHLAKANLLFSHNWDFQQAHHHYERSLGSAASYFHYSQFLLAMGDFERALEYSYRYQDLDPQGYSRGSVAWIRAMAGEYDSALEVIDQLHALEPENTYYHVCRRTIFEQSGRETDAYNELRWLMRHAGYDSADLEDLATAFTQKGLPGAYEWLLNDHKQLDLGHYAPPLSLARYAIQAGDYQQALHQLEQAVNKRQVEVLWIAVDPLYRSLHGYPGFNALLRKIGLQPPVAGLPATSN